MIFNKLKIFIFLIIFLFFGLIINSISFNSVCNFPLLDDNFGCQRELTMREKGKEEGYFDWFCDPELIISMSEVSLLEETINKLIKINGENCVCENNLKEENVKNNYCWYRFGCGFLKKLNLRNDVLSANQCLNNSNIIENKFNLPLNWEDNTNYWINNYGKNFVNVLRERWRMGNCGEDIVFLFVQMPPMIFISVGSLIEQNLGGLIKINQIINQTNLQLLKSSKPSFRILSNLIENIGILLINKLNNKKLNNNNKKRIINNQKFNIITTTTRNHIPLWAWFVFGLCCLSFLLMALSLFAIKRKTRRGSQSKKPKCQGNAAMVARRHWKEGEEQLQQTPQTYVNLVQMLMPHPKASPTNFQQQV